MSLLDVSVLYVCAIIFYICLLTTIVKNIPLQEMISELLSVKHQKINGNCNSSNLIHNLSCAAILPDISN